MFKNFLNFLWELVKVVAISLIIIIPIRTFLIQPFYVKGASMEPNFYDKEYLIIDKLSYRMHEPQRGDIIVFKYPNDPKEYFIKRVIGLPGEKVQVKEGGVFIYNNDHPQGYKLGESYISDSIKTYAFNEETVTLNAGEYYVMGDNRNASKDSRSFGSVDKSYIIGRVMFRGWPLDRINVFSAPQYSY